MNRKFFLTIIVVIITITNIILFINFYTSRIEDNNEKIIKENYIK